MIVDIPIHTRVKKPRGRVRVNKNHPLAKGLQAYWLMNEGGGTDIRDIAGNAHGKLNGGTWVLTDKGWCLNFTNASGCVNLISEFLLPAASNARTFLISYQTSVISLLWKVAFLYGTQAGNGQYFEVGQSYGNAGTWQKKQYLQDQGNQIVGNQPPLNTWHLLAITFVGGSSTATTTLIENGTPASSGNIIINTVKGVGGKQIGYPGYSVDGNIEYAMMYDRVLSARDINTLRDNPYIFLQSPLLVHQQPYEPIPVSNFNAMHSNNFNGAPFGGVMI